MVGSHIYRNHNVQTALEHVLATRKSNWFRSRMMSRNPLLQKDKKSFKAVNGSFKESRNLLGNTFREKVGREGIVVSHARQYQSFWKIVSKFGRQIPFSLEQIIPIGFSGLIPMRSSVSGPNDEIRIWFNNPHGFNG